MDLLTISSLFRDGSLFPRPSTSWRGDTHVAILTHARVFYFDSPYPGETLGLRVFFLMDP